MFHRKLSELSVGSRIRSGKEFHEVGPATEKNPEAPERVQRFSRLRGCTVRCCRLAERIVDDGRRLPKRGCAKVDLWSFLLQAAMNGDAQLVVDAFWNVETAVRQRRQRLAPVYLSSWECGSVQHVRGAVPTAVADELPDNVTPLSFCSPRCDK